MKYVLNILRREHPAAASYWQSFVLESDDAGMTVAAALQRLNAETPLRDSAGKRAAPIRWDCGCLQKKCGACAMVICSKPMLACDAELDALGGEITLEPLHKFPVVADLVVDRSSLMAHLQEMNAWLQNESAPTERKQPFLYEASRCLQCGLCLEICPNFYPGGTFYGMAAMTPSARLLQLEEKRDRKSLQKAYARHVFAGCGKSLACRDICPAKLDIEQLLSRSNAITFFR